MKAAVYYEQGGPEVLRYEEVPEPELKPGGVLVDVKAIGLQGGDMSHRRGYGELPPVPHIVGYQASGVVRSVGTLTTTVRPGDRVVARMAAGSHAEVVSVPEASVTLMPQALGFEEAACVPAEFVTADECLFGSGHLEAGQHVLIQAGASGVGMAAIQLAKRAGAIVLATASSQDRLERLRPLGMDEGINYLNDEVATRVAEITDGRGVDLVVDPVGYTSLTQSISALAYRGRVCWVGNVGRQPETPVELSRLFQANGSLVGVSLTAVGKHERDALDRARERYLAEVADGQLQVILDRTYPLAEAAAAHERAESRQSFGRVVMVP